MLTETKPAFLPPGKSVEYVRGRELIGVGASNFFAAFTANNLDLVVSGGIYEYPSDLGKRHHTKPSDHSPRTMTNSPTEVLDRIQAVRTKFEVGYCTSLALGFELQPDKFDLTKPFCASLIGLDVELPPSPEHLQQLTTYCNSRYEPFVLFQASDRSYFLVLLGQIYRDNLSLFNRYMRFIDGYEDIITLTQPFYNYYYHTLHGSMGAQSDPDYQKIAERVNNTATHQEDTGHTLFFDIRHFAHSIFTNNRKRANPDDARVGCDFQLCMRIGEKTGSDEFRIAAASDRVPIRIENATDGSIMMSPEVHYNCGLS